MAEMMEKQRKELIDAGEINEDEKLSFTEILMRYTRYQMKKLQGKSKGAGSVASDTQSAKPVAPKPPSGAPGKKDSIEVRLQSQYHDSLNKLLAPSMKVRECMKQTESIIVEFLKTQHPVLAGEYSNLQAWLAKSTDEGIEKKTFLELVKTKTLALQKLLDKVLAPSADLQKRMESLRAEVHKKNTEIESLHREMAERAKEMESILDGTIEGVTE